MKYQDRPKSHIDVQTLLLNYERAGLKTIYPYSEYIGLDAVHYYTRIPWEKIVASAYSGDLKVSFFGSIGLGLGLEEEGGFPFTRWEWVDDWIEHIEETGEEK